MNLQEQPKLAQMLEEVCAIYSRPFSEVLVHAYYRVLKTYSFEAVSKAMLRILGDDGRRQIMPTAAEIKALAQHLESTDIQRYLPCQHQGCEGLLAWPPAGLISEHSYYCPRHKPAWQAEWSDEKHRANRVTPAEKHEILEEATPSGRAFLRGVLPQLMEDIPITPEEQAITDADAVPLRAKVFEATATGPGVNPSVFLNGKVTEDRSWMDNHKARREIVRAGGYHYDAENAVWVRKRQRLTEEQIDGFPSLELLTQFAKGRG